MNGRAALLCALAALALAAPARAQQVELRWSRARAFVHQQVQLAAVVVHPVSLNPRWEPPPFEGFAVERLPSEGSAMRREGQDRYVRTTHLRYALFPTRDGVIEVPPSRILFLDVAGRESALALPGTRLTVDPLPAQGRPAGFDATVGEVSVRATLEPRSLAVGEYARLELDVFGVANVWDVAAPDLATQLGAACEVFPEPPGLDRTVHDQGLFARKTFRFFLVPSEEGRLRIPAFEVPHFDPEQQSFRVARSDALEIEVLPARASSAPSAVTELPRESGWSDWLPTLLLVCAALGVGAWLLRPRADVLAPACAPREPALDPVPAPARVDPEHLLRHAEASLEEPGFGALLARALRAAVPDAEASLTTSELAARVADAELIALLRGIDAERFSGHASLEQRRALLDAAVAYVRRRAAASGATGAPGASTPPPHSR